MATQDLGYTQHRRSQELKKIETLQSELHFIGSSETSHNMHTVFVDSKDEGSFIWW